MSEERVMLTESYYRSPSGEVRVRLSIGEQIVMDSLAFSFWFNVTRPTFLRPYFDPNAKYAWWDGSCLCKALVKEGPKALIHVAR